MKIMWQPTAAAVVMEAEIGVGRVRVKEVANTSSPPFAPGRDVPWVALTPIEAAASLGWSREFYRPG